MSNDTETIIETIRETFAHKEFASSALLKDLKQDTKEIKDHLRTLNGRVGKNEMEIAVLKNENTHTGVFKRNIWSIAMVPIGGVLAAIITLVLQ